MKRVFLVWVLCMCRLGLLAGSLAAESEAVDSVRKGRGPAVGSGAIKLVDANREQIYHRATNQFDVADFFKPVESNTEGLTFKLAPLILQELEANTPTNAFGVLSLSSQMPILDLSRPTVYASRDSVELNGKPHARFLYTWFYSVPGGCHTNGALVAQGIRLTLNLSGEPVIWEVMADPSECELIFVSEGLETTAAKQFGKALPGRRYAIERSLAEAPETVVVRVIDDGPGPMGPIVYLSAGTGSVSTVICRCMPAQAKKLGVTRNYELLEVDTVPRLVFEKLLGRWSWRSNSSGLGKALRLPDPL